MSRGDYAAAAELYSRLAQELPDDAGVAANHGVALHMAGRFHEAIPKLRDGLATGNDTTHLDFLIGTAHLALNEPGNALPHLRRASETGPEIAEAAGALAETYTRLGRHIEAAGQYRRWSRLAPTNAAAWNGLGRGYATLAQAAFDALEKSAPESAYMVALAAEIQLARGKNASALHLYRDALSRDPALPGVHRGLAEIYRRTGHPDWAATEESREPLRSDAECERGVAACLHQRGRWLELADAALAMPKPEMHFWASRAFDALSTEAYRRLNALPPSVESHEFAARGHRDESRHGAAVAAWRAALALRPSDERLETELAFSLQMNRDYSGARPLLERLVARNPQSVELNYSLGLVLLNLQEVEASTRHLELVATQAPGFLPARGSLGYAYLQLGRAGEAVPHLEAALPADTDASTHFRLAQAYRQAGQAARAEEMLQRYRRAKQLLDERSAHERSLGIVPP